MFYGRRLKDNASGAWMTWRSILQHYSRALLTKEEEKLFVMAGIAAYFHSLWGGKYLAGLWQKGVERQLLWSSAHSLKFMQLSSSPIHRRPSRYRAPSWSWASLDGPIVGCRWMGNDFHEVAIRVLAANIKLLSEDQPFGSVQYGSLTIECGQLKRTLIKSDQIWLQTEPEPKRLSYTIDVISAKPLESVFLLLVDDHSVHLDRNGQEHISLEGLMLISTQTPGTYERFGHFRIFCTPGHGLSLEYYLALPGIEDKEAYEQTIPGECDGELRYVISLV